MPDDAIERARQIIDRHREYMGVGQVMMKVTNATAAVVEALAFASQQAPGMVLVPRVCPEPWLTRAKKLLGADAAEAQIIWSAMLDAAPSVTLGEVG